MAQVWSISVARRPSFFPRLARSVLVLGVLALAIGRDDRSRRSGDVGPELDRRHRGLDRAARRGQHRARTGSRSGADAEGSRVARPVARRSPGRGGVDRAPGAGRAAWWARQWVRHTSRALRHLSAAGSGPACACSCLAPLRTADRVEPREVRRLVWRDPPPNVPSVRRQPPPLHRCRRSAGAPAGRRSAASEAPATGAETGRLTTSRRRALSQAVDRSPLTGGDTDGPATEVCAAGHRDAAPPRPSAPGPVGILRSPRGVVGF